ncbi:MAG TPA: hypothetical protein VFB99_17140 [Vicinamibacterales bacterium]|nr:hypothetical protein [Vicinamibacterales bacterium]
MTLPDMRPWGRQALTIPPNSRIAWIHLAIWELWMGMIVCVTLGLGLALISTSPRRIVAVSDLSNCYAPPPVVLPCERTVYRGGALDAAFTSLCGLMLIGVALWFLWELWSAVEPKPITDDFLRLLHDSFSRDWRNPFTWPWARVLWAYGFTVVGVVLTAGVGLMLWMLVVPSASTSTPTVKVKTSQSYTLGK